jgi:UDP-N-acetylglucosamine acyltransferase
MPEISKFAFVEPSAKLADDVRVGAFTYIGPQVRIGRGCVIENNVTIAGRTTLGERNRVLPLAVIGSGEGEAAGAVTIGAGNVIREHVTIVGGMEQPTRVGADNLIMIGCQLGAGCQVGDHGILVNCTLIGPGAIVEDYVRTSAFIMIEPGVRVGAYTFTLGYAEIDRDAPPFAMVQGSPFRVRGVNTENLKRCGFGEDDIRRLKNAFRELFNGNEGYAVDEAVLGRLLADKQGNPHVSRLAQAVARSEERSR